jgi:hypothetical protein
MSRYVITFFARDTENRRMKRFPAANYSWIDEDGEYHWWHGMHPTTIEAMLNWFDEHPLSGMLRSYGIDWALTDISTSSIIVNLKAEDAEMEEEMLVTLKMFAGPDIRICPPENVPRPRTARERAVGLQVKDRYAR